VRPRKTEGIYLPDGNPTPLIFDWQIIGEYEGHGFFEEEKILSNEDSAPNPYQVFERVILSMTRDATEAALKELEEAAHAYNSEFSTISEYAQVDGASTIGWNDSAISTDSEAENLVQDAFCLSNPHLDTDRNDVTESVAADASSKDAEHKVPDESFIVPTEENSHQEKELIRETASPLKIFDLPPPDWSEFFHLETELRPISTEELMTSLTKLSFHRYQTEPQIPAVILSDARQGAARIDKFSEVDDVTARSPATPVLAPEGSLLALLERWWRGEVRNRAPLREELEKEVRDAVERLEAHIQYARESFKRYEIDPSKVMIAKHEDDV
jgi:hypothetical protein